MEFQVTKKKTGTVQMTIQVTSLGNTDNDTQNECRKGKIRKKTKVDRRL